MKEYKGVYFKVFASDHKSWKTMKVWPERGETFPESEIPRVVSAFMTSINESLPQGYVMRCVHTNKPNSFNVVHNLAHA